MNFSKFLVSNVVSATLIFAPLASHAQSNNEILQEIQATKQELADKTAQLAAISAIIAIEQKKGNIDESKAFATAALATSVSSTVLMMGLAGIAERLNEKQLIALEQYKSKTTEIANKAMNIIDPNVRLYTRGLDYDYYKVTAQKNTEALRKLEQLAKGLTSSEMKMTSAMIAHSTDPSTGSWWVLDKSLKSYPESKLAKAVKRASLRTKVMQSALAVLIVTMGASTVTAAVSTATSGVNVEGRLKALPSNIRQLAEGDLAHLEEVEKSGGKEMLKQELDRYALMSIQISSEIALARDKISELNKKISVLN